MKAFILVLAFCGFVGFSHAGEGAFLAEGAPSTFEAIGAAAVSRSATVEDCERPSEALRLEALETAEAAADAEARKACESVPARANRASDYEVRASCGYSGPFRSVLTLRIQVSVEYACEPNS